MPQHSERGATSVAQTVLVAPTLLAVLMLIVQVGLLLHARNVAQQAAQHGVTAGRAYDGSAAAAQASASDFLATLGDRTLQDRSVEVARSDAAARVTVTGTVIALVPWLELGVRETAEGPVERYVPEPAQ